MKGLIRGAMETNLYQSKLAWMMIFLHLIISSLHANTHPCAERKKMNTEADTMLYFQRYGYLETDPSGLGELSEENWIDSIKRFQRFAAINQTGILDTDTFEMLNKPRCGNDDRQTQRQRKRRFATSEGIWQKTELTYKIAKYTPDLEVSAVDNIIAEAFKEWAAVTPLTFLLKPHGAVDLEIKFTDQRHGDQAPFDGLGGTLAHAFFPPENEWSPAIAGDTHFDEDEHWIEIGNANGTPLICVAIHEIGHSLGIRHSVDPESIMWPWAGECIEKPELAADDINAIQHLYGDLTSTETSTRPSPREATIRQLVTSDASTEEMASLNPPTSSLKTTEQPTSSILSISSSILPSIEALSTLPSTQSNGCNGRVDAVTFAQDGRIYVFRDTQVFLIDHGVVNGFPKNIGDIFPDAPARVSAAFAYKKGKKKKHHHRRKHRSLSRKYEGTFLFSGDKVWKYKYDRRHGFRLDRKSPQTVNRVFKGVDARSIDASFISARNGDLYLIGGEDYWRHDGSRHGHDGYPLEWKRHGVYSALPSIDAAFIFNGYNYFFSGDNFYKWDDEIGRMTEARNTAYFLFLCPEGPYTESPNIFEIDE